MVAQKTGCRVEFGVAAIKRTIEVPANVVPQCVKMHSLLSSFNSKKNNHVDYQSMDYLSPDHPFFSAENIEAILKLVEGRIEEATGQKLAFHANEEFTKQMFAAAEQYPELMITETVSEGLGKLNDIIARRALAALTAGEDAGTYIEGNKLYKQTRRVRRFDDGVRDPTRQNAGVILGGNVYKKANDEFQSEITRTQQAYLSSPAEDRFAKTRPVLHEDTKFREL